MRFVTNLSATMIAIYLAAGGSGSADVFEDILRTTAIEFGVNSQIKIEEAPDPGKIELGRQLFADKLLSLNGDISCQSCHLDRFASADGLPYAVGVGGIGEGPDRMASNGVLVPRNTPALWGRGGPGFDTFFWDGKVERRGDQIVSQFGAEPPSPDPLIVAVHLPFVEIREMVVDDSEVNQALKTETVNSATDIFEILAARVRSSEKYSVAFRNAFEIASEDIRFLHVAEVIAGFIRHKFQAGNTRFREFLAGAKVLSEAEVRGGLVFFGKGKCATCHNGPYFSDFDFHAVALPQLGFGKNGFGVDYGRFNVTHNAYDQYKFRTPPLLSVVLTAPYGHSGNTYELADAIRAHFDPLAFADFSDPFQRTEFYRRLLAAADDRDSVGFLDEEDLELLVKFLSTLNVRTDEN